MNISYQIVGLLRQDDGSVVVSLVGIANPSNRCTVTLPAASPAIAALTIGRQVDATFAAV
jgi:hypothetical protein